MGGCVQFDGCTTPTHKIEYVTFFEWCIRKCTRKIREKCLWVMWSEGWPSISCEPGRPCAEWGTFKSGWAKRVLSPIRWFLTFKKYIYFHFSLRVKRWTVENPWGEQPGISVLISLPQCSCFLSYIWASFSFFLAASRVAVGIVLPTPAAPTIFLSIQKSKDNPRIKGTSAESSRRLTNEVCHHQGSAQLGTVHSCVTTTVKDWKKGEPVEVCFVPGTRNNDGGPKQQEDILRKCLHLKLS